MSVWMWVAGIGSGVIFAQGTTRYLSLRGELVAHATESVYQYLATASFTLSNLYVRATAANGINTVRLRVNTFDQTNTVSVTGTGTFEDTTHTDALVDGDLVDTVVVIGGSHNNAATLTLVSYLVDDGGANVTAHQCVPLVAAGATTYMSIGGAAVTATTTEAFAQYPVRVAATLSNLRANVTTHGASTDTIVPRINAASGAQSLSYTSGETGVKEDTVATDTVSVGDLLAYSLASGSALQVALLAMKVAATGDMLLTQKLDTTHSPPANQTFYYPCAGTYYTPGATEANVQLKARTAQILRNFFANISANSRSDSTTIDVRVGAASSALGVSVGAGVTGITEDLSDSVTLATTDLINYRLVTGAGTGTITMVGLGVQQGGEAPGQPVPRIPVPLWRTRAPLYVR